MSLFDLQKSIFISSLSVGSLQCSAGAIEVLTDANDAPHFKRADLGRFLGIVVVARNNSDKVSIGVV